MATPHQGGSSAVSPDTLITVKVSVNDAAKKLKLPLRDLHQQHLLPKLRQILDVKPHQHMVVERYSDSASGYITLDESNPQVFKTLIRAAKAKLKLRLKATVTPLDSAPVEEKVTVQAAPAMESAPTTKRDSTALDQRSVGSGIFQFREARASQQTLVNDEAPVPRPFTTNQQPFFTNLVTQGSKPELAFRTREPAAAPVNQCAAWSVYCNACDKAMINAHFHCSICDGGDYDLCEECVAQGKLCPGEGHWLIKRSIQDGKVVNSTTERIQPSKAKVATFHTQPEIESPKEMPGAFTDEVEVKTLAEDARAPTRTCNNCVIVLAEREFVTCTTCDDFDLCIKCHTDDKHGHHPAHGFQPATEETILHLAAETKLAPGRNVRHNAICDGCDKKVFGVRHKCLNCPDWDYCNDCIKEARTSHPHHRFAALYQPIPDQFPNNVRHSGIYCDGPLCSKLPKQTYIQGVRYKCTICHDTDFCASCEALPGNPHNRTHPLIQLKTPVRNVNISTESEDVRGRVRVMGDRAPPSAGPKTTATEAAPSQGQQANTATPVQTVAEIKPTEIKEVVPVPFKVEIKKKNEEPASVPVKKFVQNVAPVPEVPTTLLNAHFMHDIIQDGQTFEPEAKFTQIWTMKNPGPFPWPPGCSVRYVGGDNMLDLDNSHPAPLAAINNATESNVVGRAVAVGEEVAFKITLKAPKREGRSISYWRLKSADNTPFGHRLWCDIVVKKAEPELAFNGPSSDAIVQAQMSALKRQASQLKQSLHEQKKAFAEQTPSPPQCHPWVNGYLPAPPAMPGFPQMPHLPQVPMPNVPMPQGPMPPFRQFHHGAPFPGFVSHHDRFQPQPGQSPPVPSPAEQPPAYDNTNIAGRLAAMREQQKQRREAMMNQMQAQREAEHTMNNERRETIKHRVNHMKANMMKFREERERMVEANQKAAEEQLKAVEKMKTEVKAKSLVDFTQQKSSTAEDTVKKIVEEAVKAVPTDEPEVATKAPAEADASTKPAPSVLETSAKDAEEELRGSQMVFPKLEKESPESSTYQSFSSHSGKGKAAYVENEDGEIERSATPSNAASVPAPIVSSPVVGEGEYEEEFESVDDELEVLSALDELSDDDGFVTDEEYDILDASDNETIA